MTVLYDAIDGVATITLNRPERRNAVSRELMSDFEQAVNRAAADATVRAVVLTGAGADFCVGRDHASDPSSRIVEGVSAEADRVRLRSASRVIEALIDLPKPSIAAIRGGCAGGGLSFALACDLRISADTAVFNSAFVAVGFPGDLALPWILTRVLGTAKAREIMLFPDKLSASQALAHGLLTEVVGVENLDSRVHALVRRLADSAPMAIRGARMNLEEAVRRPLPEYLVGEVDRLIGAAYSPDAEEARRAFLEKRTPAYSTSNLSVGASL
ncbi:enoyl-CoA hydratase/isomerase family protein [Rhodococcus sp. OK302]|uniref:enoyl-CoA hydratase/isomerase family protein n=1 Tax=Rhodococcus sp. OK302 TaxID=1882769 RepID=UPI000B94255E|nr:enoyl-CoA hydratase-related protein [Rhodococcus sp. OK302]OYD66648.1 enoyl-CoA hydratase [Rhodococcus sp. OK302]